mmetsp:Transcript_30269/g.88557  ORF Transcript_30269/g.88557 Transcript_30269/m.88557 type:complete len:92 (+) Transcript_30269:837-1112(+)
MWNEVNMYYGPGDGDAAGVMWRNLLGLVHIRGGTDRDRQHLRQLRDHFQRLGRQVPVFELTMEPWGSLESWDDREDIDLRAEPFKLRELIP